MPKKKNPHYKTNSMLDTKKEVELEPCVKWVTEEWSAWDNHWGSKFGDFEKYYDQWIGKPPVRDEDWQSQFHKRLTWQAEKVLVSRFHSALFPTAAPIATDSTEVTDEFQAIIAKSTVGHWFKIGEVIKEFLATMRSAAIYGSGFFEDDWYQKVENVPEKYETDIPDYRNMIDEFNNQIFDEQGNARMTQIGTRKVKRERTRKQVVEDRYRVRKSNIFAWRIHPNKLSDDDDFPVIKQEFITFEQLKERQKLFEQYGLGGFENMDKIEQDVFKPKEEDTKRLQKDGTYTDKKNPRLEVLNFYGLYGEGSEEKKPSWIQVVNHKYKLKRTLNPFWHQKSPLFHIVWTEDEKDSYYGIGIPQIGKDAEDRANNVVNIRTDIKKKNVRGTGYYNAADKKIKKSHVMNNTPGFMRPCSDVNNAAKYDIPPPLAADDYKEEETAVNDHRDITGAATPLMPASDKKEQHDTLGGMQLILSQAAQRLKPDLAMMEIMGIKRIANRALLLTMQFMSQPTMIELLAPTNKLKQFNIGKIYELQPGEIRQKVNFHCTGLSETIEKGQNIDKLMKYAKVTAGIPPMQMVTNYQGIGKRVALFLGFEDIEELVLMNPQFPLQPTQQPQIPPQSPQGAIPGQIPGQGIPQGGAPGQGGGLPPEMIAQIAQSIGGGAPPGI